MKTIEIKVTKQDIAKGVRGKTHYCPVALAMGRTLRISQGRIAVDAEELDISTAEGLRTTRLPRLVRTFICKFDCAKPVKPFTFKLKLPL